MTTDNYLQQATICIDNYLQQTNNVSNFLLWLCAITVYSHITLSMWSALRITFLYIGTSVGAGFSSGRELALFFGNLSPYNVAFSAIFMSLLMALFLIAGKKEAITNRFAVQLGIFFSAAISLCAMLAGGEFVLSSLTGIPLLGLLMGIIGGVVVIYGIEKIKLANAILVPLIIILIIVIFVRLSTPSHSPNFSFTKPLLYSGLDVLLGGIIISNEGKKLSYKQIFLSCAFTGAFLAFILFMLQSVVLTDTMHSSMPVLAVAESLGLKWVCGILIATAIFTTFVSSLQIVTNILQGWVSNFAKNREIKSVKIQKIKNKKQGKFALFVKRTQKKISYRFMTLGDAKNRALVVFSCLLFGYILSFLGFETIVDTGYPFISLCGILLTLIVSCKLIAIATKTIKSKSAIKKLSHQKTKQ